MLKRCVLTVFAALAVASMSSAQSSSSVADFSDHADYGNYVVSDSIVDPTQSHLWPLTIEDAEWQVTVWAAMLSGTGQGNIQYRYRTFHKATATVESGVFGLPFLFNGPAFTNPFEPSSAAVVGSRGIAPAACFLDAAAGVPGSNQAIAIAHLQANDVWVTFLEYVPGVPGTPPTWTVVNRNPINVSNTGNASNAQIAPLQSGQFVVSWIDSSNAGAIGGKTGINPQPFNGVSGGVGLTDLYARRFRSLYPSTPSAGAQDVDPASSTVNVSDSGGTSAGPDMKSDGIGNVFVTWVELGAQADSVAGLAGGKGPQGGSAGGNAESTDVYLRKILASPGTTKLEPTTADNVSFSTGPSAGGPPALGYNRDTRQVCVVFLDSTIKTSTSISGIGGDVNLFAEPFLNPNNPLIPLQQADVFFSQYNESVQRTRVRDVTQTSEAEILGVITPFGAQGWLMGYTSSQGNSRMGSAHIVYDSNGITTGAVNNYPRQGQVANGGQLLTIVYSMSTNSFGSVPTVSLAYTHMTNNGQPGQPEDLKAGQSPTAPGRHDVFLAYGEAFTGSGTNSPIRFPRTSVYSFYPDAIPDSAADDANKRLRNNPVYNPGGVGTLGPAPRVVLAVEVRNGSAQFALSLESINVTPPRGFTLASSNPLTVPQLLGPNVTTFFEFQFTVDNTKILPGDNTFAIVGQGTLNGQSQIGTTTSTLAVLGVTGDLIGVKVTTQINPTSITTGRNNSVNFLLAIENGGQDTISGLEISGVLLDGILPFDFTFATFSPDPTTTQIQSGQVAVFTTTLTIASSIDGADPFTPSQYTPPITVKCEQGGGGGATRFGSVVATVQQPLAIRAPQPEDVAPTAPIINIEAGGCSVTKGKSWSILLMLGLAPLVFVMTARRRRA